MKLLPASMLLGFLLPLGMAAQQSASSDSATQPDLDSQATAALVRLGGQLMVAGKAYEYDRQLADDIGPRLTGSANYAEAATWAIAEFSRLGLQNVHRESWPINATWEPETYATASILLPHKQRLHLESDGWSPSTPPGGVRGSIFYLKSYTPDGVKADAAQIRNSVVLVDRSSILAGGELLYGSIIEATALLAAEGARGLLLGIGGTNNVASMVGLSCCNGSIASLPVGDLGSEDTLLLQRLLARGPVQVEFSFTNRIRERVEINNIVADIPGSDPDGQYVLIGGHLDSWQLGTGAEDNGTGAATVLAIAEAVKATGLQPRRTLRFVLFGGEEEGLLGSVHYVQQHASDLSRCAGVFISDTGSEPPTGWYTFGRDDDQQPFLALKPLLDSFGAGKTSDDGGLIFSTDDAPFVVKGVPSFVLWTPTDKYSLLHHKPSDTFDKVNQRDLNLDAAVVGITAFAFADATTSIRHLSPSEVEAQLTKAKVLSVYKDLLTHQMF